MAAETPIVSGMAGRYATALFELALEENALKDVANGLRGFDELVSASDDLARLVRSPVFTGDEQERALVAVLKAAKIGGLAGNFLRLVAANRRLFAVREMIGVFHKLLAQHKGETAAEVTVAEKMSDQHVAALKSALKAVTGKDVALDVKIDPGIIGGLVVKLGSRMVDSSLRTKLNSIRSAMKEAR